MNIQQVAYHFSFFMLAWCVLAVDPTCAQTTIVNHVALITTDGDSTSDQFGEPVGIAGDVNGDGFPDLIIGAIGDSKNGLNSGSARVLSGFDGSVLYSFEGDSAGDAFGASVGNAGDVNGDGFSDLFVGAPFDDDNGPDSGSVRVFSGSDGNILFTFLGDSAGDQFGRSVSGGGDVNGDGVADLIVGAPADDNNGIDSGSVRVFSGSDGSVLYNFDGDSVGDTFGFSVSNADDVNGDGFADLLISANGVDDNGEDSGSARVLSGADGSVLYDFNGDETNDFFSRSVSGAGDVNGDGFADLIVGIPRGGNNGINTGAARVFSGADGSVLYDFLGESEGDLFGRSVSGAGDVNGDGNDDLIVGAPLDDNNGSNSGSVRVLSGADGSVLFSFDGDSAGDGLGRSAVAADVNGDGFADLIVGAPSNDDGGRDNGRVRVFSGANGVVLYSFIGDSAGDVFGRTENDAGDVNGDGTTDIIKGFPLDDNNGIDSGSAQVLSGTDGSILYTFLGDSAGDQFGTAISSAGDVNGDGLADLIVGAPLDDNNGDDSGSVRVFSGADGSVLHTFDGDSAGDGFGGSVSGVGDVNGDGFSDLVVGARGDDNSGTDSGSVRVFSGFDGSVLYSVDGDSAGDQFGLIVVDVGDANGDGNADLIVGAPFDDNNGVDSGSARLLSGVDGRMLNQFDGVSAGDQFGFSASGAGDANNDGAAEFIISSFYETDNKNYLFFSSVTTVLLGDCDQDGDVDFLDINHFIGFLTSNTYLAEADCNQDRVVSTLDIIAFIGILAEN